MRVLTTAEAARRVGVEPSTIRGWALKGYITALRPGAKPTMFREEDVIACHADRLSEAEAATLDTLAAKFLQNDADVCNDSARRGLS